MKKKIFLITTIVVILACLFTLVIGAESITYEGKEIELVNDLGDPSWYTGTTASKIQDKESIVILKDSEGNMTAYPSYYIFRFLIDSQGVRIAWANDKGVDYSFVNEKDSKNYTSGSIYYVELPYGITTCTAYNIWGKGKSEPNVVEFVIPDSVTTISYNAFAEINNCKKVTMSKNVVTIDEWSFYNSKDLETVIFPKDCAVQKIAKGSFSGCSKLSSINLENCQSLQTLGDAALSGCTAIDTLTLPDSLQTIGFQAIYNLGELELASNYLPKSLKSIDQYFLSDCQLVNDVLYFPEGFTSLSARYCFIGTFAPKTSLTLVFLGKMTSVNLVDTPLTNFLDKGSKKPIKIVFAQNSFSDISNGVVETVELNGQKGFVAISKDGRPLYTENKEGTLTITFENANYYNLTGIGADANGNTIYSAESSPTEIIFCGGDSVEVSYTIRCNHTEKGWYRFHTTPEQYDMDAHNSANIHYDKIVVESYVNCGYDGVTTNTCVICDKTASVVVPATGNHIYTIDDNCATEHACETCEKIVVEAKEHKALVAISYASFDKEGTRIIDCGNEGCKYHEEAVAPALFVCLGYSSPMDDRGELTIGFTVDKDAIAEYEGSTGEKISFGVFAVLKERIGNEDIFADGAPLSETIVADLTNHSIVAFELRLLGFEGELRDIELAMGAYVYDGKEKAYSYLQFEAPDEGFKYHFSSYNEIIG